MATINYGNTKKRKKAFENLSQGLSDLKKVSDKKKESQEKTDKFVEGANKQLETASNGSVEMRRKKRKKAFSLGVDY